MIAALDDAGGGDERELRVLLKIGDRGHAAVAHGGFDLIKATRDIILQRDCVGEIVFLYPVLASLISRLAITMQTVIALCPINRLSPAKAELSISKLVIL